MAGLRIAARRDGAAARASLSEDWASSARPTKKPDSIRMERDGLRHPRRLRDAGSGLVAAQAARSPQAIAVADERQRLTYAELMRRVGELADRLRGGRRGKERCVGVLSRALGGPGRSPHWASSRAAPPTCRRTSIYPPDRLAFMAGDAQLTVLVSAARPRGSPARAPGADGLDRWGPRRRGPGAAGGGASAPGQPSLPHLHLRLHRAAEGHGDRAPPGGGAGAVGADGLFRARADGRPLLDLDLLRSLGLRALRHPGGRREGDRGRKCPGAAGAPAARRGHAAQHRPLGRGGARAPGGDPGLGRHDLPGRRAALCRARRPPLFLSPGSSRCSTSTDRRKTRRIRPMPSGCRAGRPPSGG